MDKNLRNFGNGLKRARKKAGYKTQKDLAAVLTAAGMPVTKDTIENWEQSKSCPSMGDFLKLCDFFDCSADYLLYKIDEKDHDLQFIHDVTGLSDASITVLHHINSLPKDLYDETATINRKILFIINMILKKEATEISKVQSIKTYCSSGLFTLIYDYLASDYMKFISKETNIPLDTITVADDLSFYPVEVNIPALMKEAKISEIRKELDSFKITKKQSKKPC